MSKRLNSKYKIDRRLGVNLWGRPKSTFNLRPTPPGQHGARRKKPSDFGTQLMAKQRLKGYYGNIGERQFRNLYKEAERLPGDTSENLIGLLEARLDAVVYRSKFATTVFAARQLVSHRHVTVNGRSVNIPSYRLKIGDVVAVREKSREKYFIIEAGESPERDIPDYIDVDEVKKAASLTYTPKLEHVPYAAKMEPNLVVEFYSR